MFHTVIDTLRDMRDYVSFSHRDEVVIKWMVMNNFLQLFGIINAHKVNLWGSGLFSEFTSACDLVIKKFFMNEIWC